MEGDNRIFHFVVKARISISGSVISTSAIGVAVMPNLRGNLKSFSCPRGAVSSRTVSFALDFHAAEIGEIASVDEFVRLRSRMRVSFVESWGREMKSVPPL